MAEPKMLTVEVAGHRKPRLQAYVGVNRCGRITDGVALANAGTSLRDTEGLWVIAFDDLERIYLAAKEARESPAEAA